MRIDRGERWSRLRTFSEGSSLKFWKRPLLFGLGAVGCVLLYLFLLNLRQIGIRSPTAGVIPVALLAVAAASLTAVFLRAEGWSPEVLGVSGKRRPLAVFACGAVAGATLTAGWMIIVTVATGATWHRNPSFDFGVLGVSLLFNLFNNIGEELIYRGYLFLRLLQRWSEAATVVITSAIFAVLHLQAGLPWLSVLAAVFTSGMIFAAVFARWRSLPLALGVHVATNVVQDATGLRSGRASFWSADYPPEAATKGPVILISIALLNLAVVLLILRWRRGRREARCVFGDNTLDSGATSTR